MDVTGLLLVGGAFSLLLLPMTLHNQLAGGWKDKGIIIMFVFGSVLLIVFAVWELRFSEKPLMSKFVPLPLYITALNLTCLRGTLGRSSTRR